MSAVSAWARATMSAVRITRRADSVAMVVAAGLIGVVTAGMVLAQHALDEGREQSLQFALAAATGDATRLRLDVADVFTPSGGDPLAAPRRRIDSAVETVDPLVRSVYDDPRLVVDSPDLIATTVDGAAPASPTTVVLRVQTGLDEHTSRIDGRAPDPDLDQEDDVPVVSVSLAEESARVLGWTLGTDVLLGADVDDPLFRGFAELPDPFIVRVTEIVALDEVDDPFWSGDARLHRPIVEDTGFGADFTVHASIREAQLPVLLSILGGQSALRVEQRWDLDPARIDMSNVDAIESAVRATEASIPRTAPFGSPALAIGLGPALQSEASRRGAASDAIAVAAVGLGAATAATFIQLQRVAAERRRPWWQQTRARGAGAAAMVAASLVTVAGVVVAATATGALAGALLAGTSDALPPVGAVALFAASLLVVSSIVQIREVRGLLDGDAGRSASRWTRAVSIVVVTVAAASVVTLRRRGIRVGDGDLDVVLLLPIVFVPLALTVCVVAVIGGVLGTRTIGDLDGGVGRLVGRRRATTMRSAPAVIAAMSLAVSVTVTTGLVAWTFGSGGDGTGAPEGPLVDAARRAFVGAAIGAWTMAAGTMAIATAITMRRRRADAGLLAALGADRSEFRAAIVAELVPLAALAIGTGGVAGAITITALSSRLDLTALTGVDTLSSVTLVGGTVVVMISALGAALAVVLVSVRRGQAQALGTLRTTTESVDR